jgi:hypothetical protein
MKYLLEIGKKTHEWQYQTLFVINTEKIKFFYYLEFWIICNDLSLSCKHFVTEG